MIALVARQTLTTPAGELVAAGQIFEAPPLEAVLHLQARRAVFAPRGAQPPRRPAKGTYQRRDLVARDPIVDAAPEAPAVETPTDPPPTSPPPEAPIVDDPTDPETRPLQAPAPGSPAKRSPTKKSTR